MSQRNPFRILIRRKLHPPYYHPAITSSGADLESAKSLLEESNKKQALKSVRRDWYQTDTHVIITVLIKKVKADDVSVSYSPDSLDFSVKLPEKDVTYELKLALEKKIDPEASAFKITPSKIEIRLKKGDEWYHVRQ